MPIYRNAEGTHGQTQRKVGNPLSSTGLLKIF